jgi:hypothetical protein
MRIITFAAGIVLGVYLQQTYNLPLVKDAFVTIYKEFEKKEQELRKDNPPPPPPNPKTNNEKEKK